MQDFQKMVLDRGGLKEKEFNKKLIITNTKSYKIIEEKNDLFRNI